MSVSAAPSIVPPTEIIVHQQSRRLEIVFGESERYALDFEFLRVESPSAAVRGHGPGQEVLQTGMRDVTVVRIEPVGRYGIRPIFSDGHDTGIYTWAYLQTLGRDHDRLWAGYLARLAEAGATRDAPGADPLVSEASRR